MSAIPSIGGAGGAGGVTSNPEELNKKKQKHTDVTGALAFNVNPQAQNANFTALA